jgi:hypothetical protein
MKNTHLLLTFAALMAPAAVKAQQNPQPAQTLQPSQAQAASQQVAAPCAKQAPPRKAGWLEKKAKAIACSHNKQLCDLPSSTDEVTGGTSNAKPCPANPVPNSPPTKSASAATDKPAIPTNAAVAPANNKPVFVCPPKTTLIPNYAYCLTADHTVVDAILLPPSLSSAPPAVAAPAPAQH